jgi:uncharacterized repeat protein (TIGR03843 family)
MVTPSIDLLARGAVTVKGRMPWSSNATFLVDVVLGDVEGLAVYKPARGERPLWDFPPGLFKRELAAWLLSEALGWALVPPTVVREDAPLGPGALQLFIQADFEQHYFTLVAIPAHRERLQRICVFDLIANNADRKSGHCLLGPDGLIYAIDNGLCFHVESKLRTVIWEFGGTSIPEALLRDVRRLVKTGLPPDLSRLLAPDESTGLLTRARRLLEERQFPADTGGDRYPWPLV